MRGKFVTLEGMEGSGKTTAARALEAHYRNQGLEVLLTREPGGTVLGNELRAVLLRRRNEPLDPRAELLLLEAARAQHVAIVLRKALETHDLVLCDRFADASMAYQGSGRGLDRAFIERANEFATWGLRPDLTVLLDLTPEEALARALARIAEEKGVPEDRFEREEREFHARVRQGYLDLAKREPGRFLVLSAVEPPEEIQRAIVAAIDRLRRQSR